MHPKTMASTETFSRPQHSHGSRNARSKACPRHARRSPEQRGIVCWEECIDPDRDRKIQIFKSKTNCRNRKWYRRWGSPRQTLNLGGPQGNQFWNRTGRGSSRNRPAVAPGFLQPRRHPAQCATCTGVVPRIIRPRRDAGPSIRLTLPGRQPPIRLPASWESRAGGPVWLKHWN